MFNESLKLNFKTFKCFFFLTILPGFPAEKYFSILWSSFLVSSVSLVRDVWRLVA